MLPKMVSESNVSTTNRDLRTLSQDSPIQGNLSYKDETLAREELLSILISCGQSECMRRALRHTRDVRHRHFAARRLFAVLCPVPTYVR